MAQELKNADETRLRDILEWGFAGPPSPGHPYIAQISGVLGGRPVIRGTRIPVWQIANAILHLGESIENYRAEHPTLTLAQIHAALSYYFDHEAEIETEIEANRIERLQDDFDLTVDNRGFVNFPA
ncbi:MAG: DUF433 domain-containing protein [bacterium]